MEELADLKRPFLNFAVSLVAPIIVSLVAKISVEELSLITMLVAWPMGVIFFMPTMAFVLIWTGIRQLSGRVSSGNEFLNTLSFGGGLFLGANFAAYIWPGVS